MISPLPLIAGYCDKVIDWSQYPSLQDFKPALLAIQHAIMAYGEDIQRRLARRDPLAVVEMITFQAEAESYVEVMNDMFDLIGRKAAE